MPKLPKRWLGIDPGKQGGFALIDSRGNVVDYQQMPQTEPDVSVILETWTATRIETKAVIECVRSSPQMGVVSAFTFGRGYGFLLGCLTGRCSLQEVRPQVWQKALGIPPRKKSEAQKHFKNRLRAEAQRMFPNLSLWGRTLTEQRAVCDALLIVEYARRVIR